MRAGLCRGVGDARRKWSGRGDLNSRPLAPQIGWRQAAPNDLEATNGAEFSECERARKVSPQVVCIGSGMHVRMVVLPLNRRIGFPCA
jgi:hypothetical protein